MGRGNLDLNVVQEILNKTKEEVENMHPVNILLAGKTGVGKSTLINNVFRERMAETGIGKICHETLAADRKGRHADCAV